MSTNRNVRDVAVDILLSIEKNQAYSNLLLNKIIEKNQVSKKDIGLLTEIVYGTLQRRATLDYFLSPFIKNKKIEQWVVVLLRMSIYQMVYLDRVPDRAVLFEAVEIAKKRGHKGISSMVNGVLRSVQRQGIPSFETIEDPIERLAIETSHPLWLVTRWVEQFGTETTRKMCEVNLLPPEQSARVNTTLTSVPDLLTRLAEEGVEATKGVLSPDAIIIAKGNLAHSNSYKEGYLTIQDESSMLVARALGIVEGDHVLDSCAAPGGKTTHIAELLQNTGSVTSIDLHQHKVKLINDQVDRLQLKNVTTRALDSRNVGDVYEKETFEKILVDAPCSGLGVIRRKPDIKYTKKITDIENLKVTQLSILDSVAPLLKKGGYLVYSTCTIDQEENDRVVEQFLNNHPDFELDRDLQNRLPEEVQPFVMNGCVQIFPHYFGTDGFFIASLRKQV